MLYLQQRPSEHHMQSTYVQHKPTKFENSHFFPRKEKLIQLYFESI